jgi:hypothetical protein
MKLSTSELRFPAVVQPQTDDNAVAPVQTTFGVLMECPDIVAGILQMPHTTSGPGSGYTGLRSGEARLNPRICSILPAAKRDLSLIYNAKPVELISVNPCI